MHTILPALALCLLPAAALAQDPAAATRRGELIIDAKLATEVHLDQAPVAQVYGPAQVLVEVPAGPHELVVFVNGSPERLQIVVPESGRTAILVGRTGVSQVLPEIDVVARVETVDIQVQAVGQVGARLRVDDKAYRLGAGEDVSVTLSPGRHDLSVRNAEGTVIWATGTLHVSGPDAVLVQLSEGRLPEVSGPAEFQNGR